MTMNGLQMTWVKNELALRHTLCHYYQGLHNSLMDQTSNQLVRGNSVNCFRKRIFTGVLSDLFWPYPPPGGKEIS